MSILFCKAFVYKLPVSFTVRRKKIFINIALVSTVPLQLKNVIKDAYGLRLVTN